MELYLLLIIAFGCFSIVCKVVKVDWPKAEGLLRNISLFSLTMLIVSIFLLAFNYRFKGAYTACIIGFLFTASTLLLFGIANGPLTKFVSSVFAMPLFFFSVLGLFADGFKVLPYILFMFFQPPLQSYEIDDSHCLEVKLGGILGCGNKLDVVGTEHLFTDKIIYTDIKSCVTPIVSIEVKDFTKDSLTLLIYHTDFTDFENPLEYGFSWSE